MNLIQMSATLFLVFSFGILAAQENSTEQEYSVTKQDIDKLIGGWTGMLTYVDYSSKKQYSMPCNLKINGNERKLKLSYSYPNEPNANSKGKIKVSKDGSTINKKKIVSKTVDSANNVEIKVEHLGKDGNEGKNALIRETYKIGMEYFVIRKEVKFEGTSNWMIRNEYDFKRN